MKKLTLVSIALLFMNQIFAQLPDLVSGRCKTAIVITDPQNDFLSPDGATWRRRESVTRNNTVENLDQLLKLPKKKISLFSYLHTTKHDQNWQIEGSLEALMHKINMFDRTGVLTTVGFENSGADWLEQYKKYIGTECDCN
jgi:hypothetical protein